MKNEDLVLEIQNGNQELLLTLWVGVRGFVVRQAHHRMTAHQLNHTENVVEVDDLIQEGFLAVLRAAESYRPGGKMTYLGWLDLYLKQAFNDALGLRTARNFRDPVRWASCLDCSIGESEKETLADILPDPAAVAAFEDIEHDMWRTSLQSALEDALAKLPADWQRILFQRYWQGQTLQQIAAAEGSTHQAISAKTTRALQRLRKQDVTGRLQEFAYQQ